MNSPLGDAPDGAAPAQPALPAATEVVAVDHVAVARLYGEPLFTLPTDLYAQDPTTATTADAELHNQPFQITSIERAIALSMDLIRSQLEIPISSDSATA